jgi:uncharacterized cupin superfamily protein
VSDSFDSTIRVITEADELAWQIIPTGEGDPNPPGEEIVVFRSGDRSLSFGLWKRAPETGPTEPPYHEIAAIIEGDVEITEPDGTVHRLGPATSSAPRRGRRPPGGRCRP